MNPTEINLLMAAITNHFYDTLSREDFLNLGLFLSMLSKDMLSMAAIEGLCRLEQRNRGEH